MKNRWKRLSAAALALVFFSVSISSLAEEITSRKFSVLEVSGTENYLNKGNGRRIKVSAGMPLGQGNILSTGAYSNIYLEADDDKLLKLDENTSAAISKASAKELEITLQNGTIFFNVEKPLAADETMKFRSANTSMSIRGTSGIFYADIDRLVLYLIEGKVEWDIGDQNLSLNAGEKLVLERSWDGLEYGPGVEVPYQLKVLEDLNWRKLDDNMLEILIENRTLIDLSSIGLDNAEELSEAIARVEQFKNDQNTARELYESKYNYDGDDDSDDDDSSTSGNGGNGGSNDNNDINDDIIIDEDEGIGDGEDEEPETTAPETSSDSNASSGSYLYRISSGSVVKEWVEHTEENGSEDASTGYFIWNSNYSQANGYYYTENAANWVSNPPFTYSEETSHPGEYLTLTDTDDQGNEQTFEVWVEHTEDTGTEEYVSDSDTTIYWLWDEAYLEANSLTDETENNPSAVLDSTP